MTSEVRPSSAIFERALHGVLRLGVEVRGRLVEDDDVGRLEQQPGDRQPLLLAAGEPVAAVADDGVEPVGQRLHEVADLGGAQRLDQLGLGRVRAGVEQVGADRVVEHVRVLGDDADGVVQRLPA